MGKDTTEEINKLILDINSYVSSDIPPEDLETFYRVFEMLCLRLKESEDILAERIESIAKKSVK